MENSEEVKVRLSHLINNVYVEESARSKVAKPRLRKIIETISQIVYSDPEALKTMLTVASDRVSKSSKEKLTIPDLPDLLTIRKRYGSRPGDPTKLLIDINGQKILLGSVAINRLRKFLNTLVI